METINFNIQGRHGKAIVCFVTTGIRLAGERFQFANNIKRNMIGSQIVDGRIYKVFETYVGSDDYFYFAVEVVD